jgi:hypothetical protein
MRALDPTCGVYSKTISKGVEKQIQYRQQLGDSMRHGAEEERTDTLRAHADVRLAVQRGLMPMPDWLAEMDRQREAALKMRGTTHAARKMTRKRREVSERMVTRNDGSKVLVRLERTGRNTWRDTSVEVQSSIADMAARLERAWRG